MATRLDQSFGQVVLMDLRDLSDLGAQSVAQTFRQRHRTIVGALPLAHEDLLAIEIQVFDAPPATFEQSEAAAVHPFGHQSRFVSPLLVPCQALPFESGEFCIVPSIHVNQPSSKFQKLTVIAFGATLLRGKGRSAATLGRRAKRVRAEMDVFVFGHSGKRPGFRPPPIPLS